MGIIFKFEDYENNTSKKKYLKRRHTLKNKTKAIKTAVQNTAESIKNICNYEKN